MFNGAELKTNTDVSSHDLVLSSPSITLQLAGPLGRPEISLVETVHEDIKLPSSL